MAKVTAERFIELVEKSGLVEAEVFTETLQKLRQENAGQIPDDISVVADYFHNAKLLTRWHIDKLLTGKYKGFFLGKHKLLGHLGTGGMSSVYLAEHRMMHHKRAIKVLPKSRLGNSSYLARFQLEAKAIAALNHRNIVRAHDLDNEGDTHYIVMEYVDGADLQTIVKRKFDKKKDSNEKQFLEYTQVADYIAQAAHGLQHAHDVGLIHRDVKPANLLVNQDGVVKLLDLGLALFSDDSQASLTIDYNDKVLGTADYLAPEQALNSHNVDHRADIYGLGCTMYFMLTGHPPFPDGTIAQRIAKHQAEMPKDIRLERPDCPGELEGICFKMLQKDPKFRYPNCQAIAEACETWLTKQRETAKLRLAKVGGGESSLDLGSETRGDSPSGSRGGSSGGRSSVDTVRNSASDTQTGKPRSSTSGPSTSDSGVMLPVSFNTSGDSTTGSTIDLEAEIARKTGKTSKSAPGKNTGVNPGDRSGKLGGAPQASSTGSNPNVGKLSPNPVPTTTIVSTGVPVPLFIAGLAIMFVVAVLIGFVISQVFGGNNNSKPTSSRPTTSSLSSLDRPSETESTPGTIRSLSC